LLLPSNDVEISPGFGRFVAGWRQRLRSRGITAARYASSRDATRISLPTVLHCAMSCSLRNILALGLSRGHQVSNSSLAPCDDCNATGSFFPVPLRNAAFAPVQAFRHRPIARLAFWLQSGIGEARNSARDRPLQALLNSAQSWNPACDTARSSSARSRHSSSLSAALTWPVRDFVAAAWNLLSLQYGNPAKFPAAIRFSYSFPVRVSRPQKRLEHGRAARCVCLVALVQGRNLSLRVWVTLQ